MIFHSLTFREIRILLIMAGVIFTASLFAQSERIVIDDDIFLIHLQDSVFIHETWHSFEQYGRFPSNGLIIIRGGQALMVDTPIDNDKTERLARYLMESMSVVPVKLIIGHFHNDCMGGLEYLQSIGVESVANTMTIEKTREIGLPVPSIPFRDSLVFDFNGEQIDCRYFGGGHSFDNITVWIPGSKILFGGCLIRSIDALGLGNLSDAVVSEWDMTVRRLMKKYPDIKTVIPGHGNFGGPELLNHTIELVKREKGTEF
jgi:metallo-beta-lactamase class B